MSDNKFVQLAGVDVSKHIEKKNGLSYLSWPFAIDQLMRADPLANWEFHTPEMYGETMMISCTVTAFGKPIKMHLPVMDHRNQAIKNPNAFEVNKNMMRCLVKTIACHGLGLFIYAGEDLPMDDEGNTVKAAKAAPKTAPVVAKAAPAVTTSAPVVMEGAGGAWTIKVTADPKGDINEWAALVADAAKLALSQAGSEADVLDIFRTNANIFSRLKLDAAAAHEALMKEFANSRNAFKKETA
jgi:hypothetical protein